MGMSMPRSTLMKLAQRPSSSRQNDRWEPDPTVDSGFRLYRFEVIADVGGVPTPTKQLYDLRRLHFNGKGVAPDDCPGELECKKCRNKLMLEAQGTPDSIALAQRQEAAECPTYVVIPLEEPTRFRLFNAKTTASNGILLCCARAGGWKKGDFPKYEAWKDGTGDGQLFEECVDRGADKVCGPTGRDLILTPKKLKNGISWSVRMEVDGCVVLPFMEDSKVLNPIEVNKRIKEAIAKKALGGKEGDS